MSEFGSKTTSVDLGRSGERRSGIAEDESATRTSAPVPPGQVRSRPVVDPLGGWCGGTRM
jgi:hypothetical protein